MPESKELEGLLLSTYGSSEPEELEDHFSDVSYWAHLSDFNMLYLPSPADQIAKWQMPHIYINAPCYYKGGITPPPRPSKRKRHHTRSPSICPDSEEECLEHLGLIPLRLPLLSPGQKKW